MAPVESAQAAQAPGGSPVLARVAGQLAAYREALGATERDAGLDVAVWFHTGEQLRARGRTDEAVVCFKKVIELAPDDPWAYRALADIYAAEADPRPAVVVLSTLASRMVAQRSWDEAIRALERASELAPDDAEILQELRDAYAKAGHVHSAEQVKARLAHAPRPAVRPDGAVAPPAPPAVPQGPPAADFIGVDATPNDQTEQALDRHARPAPREDRGAAEDRRAAPEPRSAPAAGDAPAAGRTRVDLLGEIVASQGWVTPDQLTEALEIQRQSGQRLGEILITMGVLSERQLAQALAQQWRRPYLDLSSHEVDPEVVRLIPAYVAQRHGVVAIARKHGRLVLAMADPANIVAIDDVRLLTGLEVEIAVASTSDIAHVHAEIYGGVADMEEALRQAQGADPEIAEDPARAEEVTIERLRTMVDEAPIVRVVNQLLTQAIAAGASDIHIEPQRREVKVRFRIDGILHDIMAPPRGVQAALISRVKILANMDIAERRLPQDGHIHLRVEGRAYDLRVSTLPTVLGEKVVIRILDQSSTRVTLEHLGFGAAQLGAWEGLITKPYGMILVTGPTGSGKTTTLYASLARINTPERNIVTIEDPVEYQMPRVNQVQVNPKTGLTFARTLRSILRQDPDVVLVGEIRDRETAEIAIQASMTGHLVLSTIHTNDAPGAVTRLVDMGVEPFLISASLVGVLAQRLVRVIDPRCKEAYTPPPEALRRLGLAGRDVRFYRGRGCDFCRGTGYRGRTGVYELMVMSDALRALVVGGASMDGLREAAQREGMRTLRQEGIRKVLEGVTTIEEMLRVVFVDGAEAA